MTIPLNKKELISYVQQELPTSNIDVGRPLDWDNYMKGLGITDLHYYVWLYKDGVGKPLHLLEFWYQRQ